LGLQSADGLPRTEATGYEYMSTTTHKTKSVRAAACYPAADFWSGLQLNLVTPYFKFHPNQGSSIASH